MPIPQKKPNEDSQKFVGRCMGNETMKKDFPDVKQRIAICLGQTRKKNKGSLIDSVIEILEYALGYEDSCEECLGYDEPLTKSNLVVPNPLDYVDFGEITEEYTLPPEMDNSIAEEYQGRKITLNKPFRTPDGPKKFSVYVKNDKDNVVKVNFGDPNMKIKKFIPERRKSFRARHHCDTNPGPRWKARYWSCKAW